MKERFGCFCIIIRCPFVVQEGTYRNILSSSPPPTPRVFAGSHDNFNLINSLYNYEVFIILLLFTANSSYISISISIF